MSESLPNSSSAESSGDSAGTIKKHGFTILKVLIGAAAIYYLVSGNKLNFTKISEIITWRSALIGVTLMALNIVFMSERWKHLLNLKFPQITSGNILKLSLIGQFFNYLVPGGVGGDFVKGFYLKRQNDVPIADTVASIFSDRIFGLLNMILLATVAVLIDFNHLVSNPGTRTLCWVVFILFIGGALFSYLTMRQPKVLITSLSVLPKKIAAPLESLIFNIGAYRSLFFKSLIYSSLSQLCALATMYYYGSLIQPSLEIKTVLLAAPIGFMLMAIPISPAGIGVGQIAFYHLFNLFNTSADHVPSLGADLVTIVQAINFALSLPGMYFYVAHGSKKNSPQRSS